MAELSPQTREEHFLARIAGVPTALVLKPETRIEHFLQKIIDNGGPSPGPGGTVTSVNGKTGAVALNVDDVGAEPEKLIVTVTKSGSTYSANKTHAEMSVARAAGKEIVVRYADHDFHVETTDMADFKFICLVYDDSDDYATVYQFVATTNGITDFWSYYETYYQPMPKAVTVSGTTPTIIPERNHDYQCGELASLTISNPPPQGVYSIKFTSGSTPTQLSVPQTLVMPDGFTVEANTRYEINVEDGYALCAGWAVSE